MKAVIMAGGEGSRLRPLTCDLPKPMARLCGRPVLEYILDLLLRHQIGEAALTLRYLPDRIAGHFPDGVYRDMPLLFVEEDKPLGTAGSVKNACGSGEEDVLVISGDALCDFDLTAAAAYHKKSGAAATILVKRVSDPREYGLVQAGEDGIITGFVEKPAFSQAVSDLANTGIYILSGSALDMIPVNRTYDFAKDLFPAMLDKGMKLCCWQGEGYWCDIGDLDAYVRCQRDMLEGKVDCDIHGRADSEGNVFAGSRPEGRYTIQPPVYIGDRVRIEDGAVLESGTVVDDGCSIGAKARITGSVLLQGACAARYARLTGTLLCAGATAKSGAMLFEGSALGAGAVAGKNATIQAGVKVWNKKAIPDGATLTDHVKLGGESRGYFDDDGISGNVGVELTPEFCARIGSALGSLYPDGKIGVGSTGQRSAVVLASAVMAGIRSTGATVLDFGRNFYARFTFSMGFCGLPAGIFVSGDNRVVLKLAGPGGLPADRTLERGVEGMLSRGEFVRCAGEEMGELVEMDGIGSLYRSQLLHYAPRGLTGGNVQIRSRNLLVKNTLREMLQKLGCDVNGQLLLELSSQGDKVRLFDPALGYIPHHKVLALCAQWQMERGKDVAVPFDAPHILEELARSHGRRVHRYFLCPADDSDRQARELAKTQQWPRDGLMQSVMLLHMAAQSGGLRQMLKRLPDYETDSRVVETSGNPAGLLRQLGQETGKIREGLVMQGEKGFVLVRPLKRGTGVKILAESRSSEIAAELCADIESLLLDKSAGES